MRSLFFCVFLAVVSVCPAGSTTVASELSVNGLSADLATAPILLDRDILFSWIVTPSQAVGTGLLRSQLEAHVVVIQDINGTNVYNSGRVNTTASALVVPASASLLNHASTYAFKVGLYSAQSAEPSWSTLEWFDTELGSWGGAEWIGGGSQLRSDLTIASPPVWARAYVSGVGAFQFHINGDQVGDHVMDPGEAVYDQHVLYLGFNVTQLLVSGTNHIGALLGNSKWGYLDIYANRTKLGDQSGDSTRAFRMVMIVKTQDGSTINFVSKPTGWYMRHGPIVYDHLWHGEIYDARQETQDHAWDAATISDYPHGTWEAAKPMELSLNMFPQLMPPIRRVDRLEAVSVKHRSTLCATPTLGGIAEEGASLYMGCQGGVGTIEKIEFVDYGVPSRGDTADCSQMRAGNCSAGSTALTTVTNMCVGKSSCVVPASTEILAGGKDPCPNIIKFLAIRARGSSDCKPTVPPPEAQVNTTILFDFGKNMAGLTTMKISGVTSSNKTLMIRLKHTETTDASGDAFTNYYPGMEFGHASKTCSMTDWYARKWYECANQTDAYIFRPSSMTAGGVITYTPTFTYHGFRFVEVSVREIIDGQEIPLSEIPFTISLTAYFTHSDVPALTKVDLAQPAGSDSARVVQQVFDATIQSHLSNLWSIPTDCPQREKRGWMGDAGISSNSLQMFYDAFAFHINFLRLIADNQKKTCLVQPQTTIYGPCAPSLNANGSVPDVVPFATGPYGGNPGTTDWQVAYVVIARNLLLNYGAEKSRPILQELWPSLEEFMDYLERRVDPKTGLLMTGARGDWVPPDGPKYFPTPTTSVAAFWHTLCIGYMAEIATALEKTQDATRYSKRLEANQKAYHTTFFNNVVDPNNPRKDIRCCYDKGSHASNIFALHLGAVPPEHVNQTLAMLVTSIYDRRATRPITHRLPGSPAPWTGAHLDCGIFGTTFAFDALHAFGEDKTAWDIINNTGYPSFGYMVSQSATTLWESWEGTAHEVHGGSSRNHIMFGGGVNRFIAASLGLSVDSRPKAAGSSRLPGWDSIIVQPSAAALESLEQGSVERKTWLGLAQTAWRWSAQTLHLTITVPHGATAAVTLPLVRGTSQAALGACLLSCDHSRTSTYCGEILEHKCSKRRDGIATLLFQLQPGSYALQMQ